MGKITHGHTIGNTAGHGLSPEYNSWYSMKARCTNPNRNVWHLYGGAGVKVCDRWAESFEAFLADMGPRPDGFSLGRIDPDGDYCPENCEWQDGRTQGRNKRTNKLTMEDARAIRASGLGNRELGRLYGVSKTMIYHIRRGAQWAE
jgi:hypothetical protein